jgi:prophage regulatory protein
MNTPTVMRPAEVEKSLGVSASTLKRWARNGYGPKRLKLGPRAVGYDAAEIDDWLRTRSAA